MWTTLSAPPRARELWARASPPRILASRRDHRLLVPDPTRRRPLGGGGIGKASYIAPPSEPWVRFSRTRFPSRWFDLRRLTEPL